eukprot:6371009-Prymnesium_polylepis.1
MRGVQKPEQTPRCLIHEVHVRCEVNSNTTSSHATQKRYGECGRDDWHEQAGRAWHNNEDQTNSAETATACNPIARLSEPQFLRQLRLLKRSQTSRKNAQKEGKSKRPQGTHQHPLTPGQVNNACGQLKSRPVFRHL